MLSSGLESYLGAFLVDGRFIYVKSTTDAGTRQLMVTTDYVTFTDFLPPFPADHLDWADASVRLLIVKQPTASTRAPDTEEYHAAICEPDHPATDGSSPGSSPATPNATMATPCAGRSAVMVAVPARTDTRTPALLLIFPVSYLSIFSP